MHAHGQSANQKFVGTDAVIHHSDFHAARQSCGIFAYSFLSRLHDTVNHLVCGRGRLGPHLIRSARYEVTSTGRLVTGTADDDSSVHSQPSSDFLDDLVTEKDTAGGLHVLVEKNKVKRPLLAQPQCLLSRRRNKRRNVTTEGLQTSFKQLAGRGAVVHKQDAEAVGEKLRRLSRLVMEEEVALLAAGDLSVLRRGEHSSIQFNNEPRTIEVVIAEVDPALHRRTEFLINEFENDIFQAHTVEDKEYIC